MNYTSRATLVAGIASLLLSSAACTAGPMFEGTTAKQEHHSAVKVNLVRATTNTALVSGPQGSAFQDGTELRATGLVDDGSNGPVDSLAATAPGCIDLQQWSVWEDNKYWKYARMTNYCSYSYSVRMIWSWAFDGSCVNLNPRATWTERRGRQAHVSELRIC